MPYTHIIRQLQRNRQVFKELLTGLTKEEYLWKPGEDKWCLLEIVCHLHDEEQEDFSARLRHVLKTPDKALPSIDPVGWVKERNYIGQDYENVLDKFLTERERSVAWLQSQNAPNWDNAYNHPKFGAMTAKMFLSNWLAHDYLHIRQIMKVKYEYLKHISGESLNYAGNWN